MLMKPTEFVSRCWYYFRMGYNTYLVFLLGYGSTLVTVYYLAIKNIPELQNIFQKFWLFVVMATMIGLPLSTMIGWIHAKRSYLWKAEFEISTEANPFIYRAAGYTREAQIPATLETLRLVKLISEKENLLDPATKKRIEDLERKLETLRDGGTVGEPKRSTSLQAKNPKLKAEPEKDDA